MSRFSPHCSHNRSHGIVGTWIERAAERRKLARLESRLLRDAGISPSDRALECSKPFWKP